LGLVEEEETGAGAEDEVDKVLARLGSLVLVLSAGVLERDLGEVESSSSYPLFLVSETVMKASVYGMGGDPPPISTGLADGKKVLSING